MRSYVALITAFVLFSCNQKEKGQIMPVNMTDSIVVQNEKTPEINTQFGDTIQLIIKDEKGNYVAEGEIDSLHPRIYVKFSNDDIGKLKAKVNPVRQGNIRFNQIIFPDKTSDGPFGVDLEHELTQTGEHTLIIGHSLMAENPYYGKFTVQLQVEEE